MTAEQAFPRDFCDPESINPFRNARIVRMNCPDDVYRNSIGGDRGSRDHVMSRSELMGFRECPKRWLLGYHDEATDATEFGTLADCVVLQPTDFHNRFVVRPATYPDQKTGEQKKWTRAANFCKEWEAKQGGRQVVSPDDNASAHGALTRLLEDPATKDLLKQSAKQVFIMAEYHDKDTGLVIPVKAMIDIVPDLEGNEMFRKCLFDFKTTTSAHPKFWQREVEKRGYHAQAAMYLWIYQAATEEDRNSFGHLLVENYPPFEPGRRLLSEEFLQLGRQRVLNALKDYSRCLESGYWPGYEPESLCLPSMPGWRVTEPTMNMLQFAD